jgi:hypothetical protein
MSQFVAQSPQKRGSVSVFTHWPPQIRIAPPVHADVD